MRREITGVGESEAPGAASSLTPLDCLMPDVDVQRVYEARIATNLNAGQALYSAALGRLYFCDRPDQSIARALEQVFAHGGTVPRFEPVTIDDKGLFAVARKVALDETQRGRAYAVLRLLGVAVRAG